MEWLESPRARRTIILAIIVVVAIVIARAVSSARGDSDELRAPNARDVGDPRGGRAGEGHHERRPAGPIRGRRFDGRP